jgi:23S rRNA pseudouridine2604 synthase
MAAALGYAVTSLKRTRIMNIELGDLPPGDAREITEDELDTLFAHINVERSAKKESGK